MICAHCQHEATRYQVPVAEGRDVRLVDVWECRGCRFRYLPIIADHATGAVIWKWMPLAGYCGDCRAEVWRHVVHPLSGQPILLWPKSTCITAVYADGHGGVAYHDYCGDDCCPDDGAAPHHPMTAGGEPISLGGCLGYLAPKDRYAFWLTAQYGDWLAAWLRDHLALEDESYESLVALWASDRAAALAAPSYPAVNVARRVEGASSPERDDGSPPAPAHPHSA